MTDYLILKLHGPMQAWGQATFEGRRPSSPFPGRSGLLGLLGACLGIRREERQRLQALDNSVAFALRCDRFTPMGGDSKVVKITDYHTVLDAREAYQGLKSHETIQTWREYLCDAAFTVAVWCHPDSPFTLDALTSAVKAPHFTPFLGRRSCPLSRPLLEAVVQADDPARALNMVLPTGGTIYSELAITGTEQRLRIRDQPMIELPRQFASHEWFVLKVEGHHASE